MSEERLIEIETRIAYQEDALRELSDALVRQQQEIDRLHALCQALQGALTSLATQGIQPAPAEERPPHY